MGGTDPHSPLDIPTPKYMLQVETMGVYLVVAVARNNPRPCNIIQLIAIISSEHSIMSKPLAFP